MAYALIFAGGTGTRMKNNKPKQFLEVDGKPIIIHTIEHFEKNDEIKGIVVVCKEDWIQYLKDKLIKYNIKKVFWIVPGGTTGQLSIYNGLMALDNAIEKKKNEIVLIHDGVRPLINDEVIVNNIRMVEKKGTCITVTPSIETVITIIDDGTVNNTVDRSKCRMAKAPQSFLLEDIINVHKDAYQKNNINNIDSATLMSSYGYKLHTITGPSENIKITTPMDYYTFKTIYAAKKGKEIVEVVEE